MKKSRIRKGKQTRSHDRIIDVAKKVLATEAKALRALASRISNDFESAVDLINANKGRVVVAGMGKSGLVGKKIAATLASTGTPAFFLHPAEASHGDLGMVTERDIVIAISNSGETEELVGLIPFLKRFRVKLISMTGHMNSTLAKASDIALDVSVREEACPMGIVPTASTTATMAMGDALAVCLLVKKGLNEEDFARFHPGGSIGKKFFITVTDLMHSGDRLPLISRGTPMSRAVIEMSSKRLGHAVVVDRQGNIAGVLTDGDVRRGLERWGGKLFDLPAEQVMTKNPKTISQDELAAKALSIMESFSITALIVPDEDGRPLGIIHLHDILRQGIV
ncbi:MAG: D-arabinose 5-phosphate isomerase [Nitrospira bacterium SM23_35]|jgi:arabinose-5-phosphate isomerase|nr:MAG: D-arabinose 5-phosphate isomerase [Nitrospira bacterium SM23_35]